MGGERSTSPAIAAKLSWKETLVSIAGLRPTITAAAAASAGIPLFCLPRYSPAR